MSEDTLVLNKILDLANACYSRDIPYSTDFLDLNMQTIFNNNLSKLPPVCFKAMGGYDLAERKIILFTPYEEFPAEIPYDIVRITPANARFADNLTHRDFLGAVLNLGINRSKTGDILVSDSETYIFVMKDMSAYVCDNLLKVKNTTIRTEIVKEIDFNYEPKFKEITGTVASVRLDAVIALGFNESRSHLIAYIEDGRVAVNGRIITTNAYSLKAGDIISVRGLGKIRFINESGTSRKGRIVITINKYI